MRATKAAVVQASPVYMNLDGCIDKASTLIKEAASNGANIIAFPETWIPGYPWFVWLGAPAWSLQFIPPYHENSMEVDSPQMKKLCQAAKENNIQVCFGFSEKAAGTRYMSQALLSENGEILFVRR
ncbi:MAG: nitrilase-related carbon-nitrogen hydrolase, partial [Pseudomonadota bacterium]